MKIVVALLCGLFFLQLQAAEPDLSGRWQQFDEDDGKPAAVIVIEQRDGVFEGRVERLFPRAGEPTDPVCASCSGAMKDQKILGLKILWNLRRNGSVYEGGQVLDPDEGKIYRAQLRLAADGRSVEVRGYVGLPAFGKTETWQRVP